MSIVSQFLPSIGDLFKLMILTVMAVTIALMVVSMADAYESNAKFELKIDSVESPNDEPW